MMQSTLTVDNGEISASVADGRLVLDMQEEMPVGRGLDLVRVRTIHLQLTPRDVARFRSLLGNLSRQARRPQAAGPNVALRVEERVQ